MRDGAEWQTPDVATLIRATLANHPLTSYMIRQKAQPLPAIFQGM